MAQIKISGPKAPASYAEISQQLGIKFAWAVQTKDGFQLQHSYVKCRDFLPDFLWMMENKDSNGKIKKGQGIYGYGHQPHHVKSPFMALEVNDGSVDALKANMEKHITGIEFVGSDGKQAIVKWQDQAMDSPWKISFFTFMLKLCCVQEADTVKSLLENGDNYSPENTYIMSVTPTRIEQILQKWSYLVDESMLVGSKSLQSLDIGHMHNYTGFVSQFKHSSTSKLAQQLKGLVS